MKYRGNHIFSEFLLIYIVPRNFLGIFRGNSEEHMFGPRNIPRKFRGKTSVPRNFLGIFRGFSEETETLKAKAGIVGKASEYSEEIPRLFRGSRVFKPKTTFCGLNNTYITLIKCLRLIMKSKICLSETLI
ncbi:hypothetical protein IGI04_026718 [Brassica rapa subsp. trilocularis]|uniref:Uncharacterized protein n=1 Tax=Brassica rapa subsp. trilocularis TaxID=1813537 RepID=A0ABQ7L0S8_BRACM|nr:hypothetical protein IGI04_026718 [Brassica rapa subsp. trilocularis]